MSQPSAPNGGVQAPLVLPGENAVSDTCTAAEGDFARLCNTLLKNFAEKQSKHEHAMTELLQRHLQEMKVMLTPPSPDPEKPIEQDANQTPMPPAAVPPTWAASRFPSSSSLPAVEAKATADQQPAEDSRPKPGNRLQSLQQRTTDFDDHKNLGRLRSKARSFAESKCFELLSVVAILANAVEIGVQADWVAQNTGQKVPEEYRALDLFFTILFTVELFIRFSSEGRAFFRLVNPRLGWNVFDSCIVTTGLIDEMLVSSMISLPEVSTIRVLRLLRLVRVLRVVRTLQAFRDLRIIVNGVLSSAKPLFWCVILLTLIMFTFSLIVMHAISYHLGSNLEEGGEPSKLLQGSEPYFGTMLQSMYTCYSMITGGVDWNDASAPLLEIHPALGFIVSIYIMFSMLCVLNVITTVFVDKANTVSKSDLDNRVMDATHEKQKWMKDMKVIFNENDIDGSAALTRHEFMAYVEDPHVQFYLESLGLAVDKRNAQDLFSLIDIDDSGTLDLEEFVEGCSQFVGAARQLDIARLRQEFHELRKQIERLLPPDGELRVGSVLTSDMRRLSRHLRENSSSTSGHSSRSFGVLPTG
eukprot:TRINITY_DN4710_c0_g1_i2.p1 TRINITY_DN4710_c0_g1~~TRINITY_DN4710_c0_g1_i2.p1  ORF type:complete len:584 (+),score=75.80 TRINITY_DN4710_c0_g1_i2:45-1796(+)